MDQQPAEREIRSFRLAPGRSQGFALLTRAFRYRNYRLFFGGQLISLVGTWMQQIAVSWLVYRLTGSALLLGLVGFLSQVPALVLSPIAGVVADRWDRRSIQEITQTLSMLQAFLVAWLLIQGTVQVWHLMVLSAFLGVVTAFDVPARQAFVADMVERKEDLPNAIALNSTMFNAARLIGPTIAGILIAAAGEGVCFMVNGFSYLAAIAALMAMTTPRHQPSQRHVLSVGSHVHEGFSYAWRSRPLRAILLLIAAVSLVGFPYTVLLPIVVKLVMGGGPETLGFLVASTGIGAVLGGVYLASQQAVQGLIWKIPAAAALFGGGLIAFAYTGSFFLSLFIMLVEGFAMMILMAGSNTLIQTLVEDDKRGRVMSIYAMAFFGVTPFGSLAAGWLANVIGVTGTIACAGVLTLAGTLVFARNIPAIRRAVLKALATQRIGTVVPAEVPMGLAAPLEEEGAGD